jgi:hypothetical protein
MRYFLLVLAIILLVLGIGCWYLSSISVDEVPDESALESFTFPERLTYDSDELVSVELSGIEYRMAGVELDCDNYLSGVDTLSLRYAFYCPEGTLISVSSMSLRNLSSGEPDIHIDDGDTITVATPDGVWSKDSDGFMADDLYFYDYLISIELPWILGAVSLWDRSAPYVLVRDGEFCFLVSDFVPGIELPESLFEGPA